MEIEKVTTRLVISVEELKAMHPGTMAGAIQKALGSGEVIVTPAPTPAQRQLPAVSGTKYVLCPKCQNQVAASRLAVHMRGAVCKRNRKRLAEAQHG